MTETKELDPHKHIAELEAQLQSWKHHARKLTYWMQCMSYNDSYFGEPAGLVKQVTHEFNRLI